MQSLVQSHFRNRRKSLPRKVSPSGFEPPTFGSGGRRSVQLSYGDTKTLAPVVYVNRQVIKVNNSVACGVDHSSLSGLTLLTIPLAAALAAFGKAAAAAPGQQRETTTAAMSHGDAELFAQLATAAFRTRRPLIRANQQLDVRGTILTFIFVNRHRQTFRRTHPIRDLDSISSTRFNQTLAEIAIRCRAAVEDATSRRMRPATARKSGGWAD